jgi:hypothetical protein
MIEDGHTVSRCTLSGGEPLLNGEIQEIIYEADRLPGLRNGRVLTNDICKDGVRKTLKLPRRWHWVPAPIDDPSDKKSGKEVHVPFFISPADHGIEASWDNCSVRGYCGKGLDSHGFSMCGVAPTIGRIIGVNPYWQDGLQPLRKIEEICKHCIYGMSDRRSTRRFCRRASNGKIEAISPTFAEGLKRHKEKAMEFNRFGQQLHQVEL